MTQQLGRLLVRLTWVALFSCLAVEGKASVHRVSLNDLDLAVDEQTGSLMYLYYPAAGVMLQASPEFAGLLDLAYPVESFAPLRLASRFSQARVHKEANGVLITWDALGASRRSFSLPAGKVSAQVGIRAAADGRSVILSCRIDNKSGLPVPQILFPDLWGLKPFAGVEQTRLRLGFDSHLPFTEPLWPAGTIWFFDRGWKEYPDSSNLLRWLDYGGLKGGLSIFERAWNVRDKPVLRSQRREADPLSLRLMWDHQTTIAPGATWQSAEFWLTPHPGGWAKGIEAYRDYVRSVNPPRPTPRHVREGLGVRLVWMAEEGDPDPTRAAFRFKDLEAIARDAKEHGIDELTPWFWSPYFKLPVTVREELGTRHDFIDGVRRARELGVNVAPFISFRTIRKSDAHRYGSGLNTNWTFHTELVPNFRPLYSRIPGLEGTEPDIGNKLWQQDVLETLSDWINSGVPSMSWDQVRPTPELVPLIEKVRALARERDPESTFSGEAPEGNIKGSLEHVAQVLDYTLMFNYAGDAGPGPILNVLGLPRFGCIIEESPLIVKKAFADGLYLWVTPKKKDRPNGTALIRERPLIAKALREVSALRRQFQPFFVDGVFLEDSMLCEPASAFVRGYQHGDKLLLIVLNDQSEPQRVTFQVNLSHWLPYSREPYQVECYNAAGRLLESFRTKSSPWLAATPLLQPMELAFMVVTSR